MKKTGQGNTILLKLAINLQLEQKAIDSLSNDMYFAFEDKRYDIKYFQPNYKWNDRIEIFVNWWWNNAKY